MKSIGAALLAVTLSSWSAFGEENGLATLSLEELSQVTVTSPARTEQKASDAPATVYVFTDKDIERRGYRNLFQLLGDVPEIEINARGSIETYNLITVRGIYGNDKNILILQDGIRISAITGSPTANHFNFPLNQAKRVEVVLGPASALYGADALVGVVNVITKDAADLNGWSIIGSGGRFSTTDNSAIFGKTFGNVGLVLSASQYYSAEPFFPEYYPQEYAGYYTYANTGTVQGFAGPVQVPIQPYSTPTKAYTVGGKIQFPDFEFGYWRSFSSLNSSLGARPEKSLYVNQAKYVATIETLYGRYTYTTPSQNWKFKTEISKGSQTTEPDSLYLDIYTDFQNAYKYEVDKSINFEEEVTYRLSPDSDLIGGFVYQDFSSLPKTADLPLPYNPDVGSGGQGYVFQGTDIPIPFYAVWYQNFGPYAQFRTRPSDWAELTIGLRYDYNTRFGGSLNPRIGAVFTPSDMLKVKLLYGEAFRAPSPYIEYQTFGSYTFTNGVPTGGFFAVPNPGLKPEKIRSLEARLSYYLTRDLEFSVDTFVNRLSNVIESESLPPGTTFMGVPINGTHEHNGGILVSYGGTARIEWATKTEKSYFKPYLAYTFVDGYLDQNTLPNTAEHTVKTGLDFNRKKLSLSPRLEYRTKSYVQNVPAAYTTAYYVINLGARYEDVFSSEKWKMAFFFNILNLLDRRYTNSNIQDVATFGATPQDPLRFELGLNLTF